MWRRQPELKWSFAGHSGEWQFIATLKWRPYLGKRSRVRPTMRWIDHRKRIEVLEQIREALKRENVTKIKPKRNEKKKKMTQSINWKVIIRAAFSFKKLVNLN